MAKRQRSENTTARKTTTRRARTASSKTGCVTCRVRRKKCDEVHPVCEACQKHRFECGYESLTRVAKSGKRREDAARPETLAHRSDRKTPTKASNLHLVFPPHRSASQDEGVLEQNALGGALPTLPEAVAGQYQQYEFCARVGEPIRTDYDATPYLLQSSGYGMPSLLDTLFDSKEASTCSEWPIPCLVEQIPRHSPINHSHINSLGDLLGSMQPHISLDESERYLWNHFSVSIQPSLFPVLRYDCGHRIAFNTTLLATHSNRAYLHSCLSAAAQHLKSWRVSTPIENLESEILRHRHATNEAIRKALGEYEDHRELLESILSIVFLQNVAATPKDDPPAVSWHQHFHTTIDLAHTSYFSFVRLDPIQSYARIPLHIAMFAWIDILGATMKCRPPVLADDYRERYNAKFNPSLGLRELMGCEDRVMYLISEIACLEYFKNSGIHDSALCESICYLEERLDNIEGEYPPTRMPFDPTCRILPAQLYVNITMAFLITARIYLRSLAPRFHPRQTQVMVLVDRLTTVLQHIPSGHDGFDRSIGWVYLVGGSVSVSGSTIRNLFNGRLLGLGSWAACGTMACLNTLLHDVWARNDELTPPSISNFAGPKPTQQYVSWRDVVTWNGWDVLFI
ncbi:hypothetical protein FSARC_576 [Fusarium sarcochroum]|uniref:Zn(2)-C6 fungal-type domain-containing protein n=1 Tax=Fusarium sarcochroum TaxID=1208366 RepID=A0A8H4UBF4_9HYPO|nr:hypothetical protein FSARC_576 [Fusarium sarcochroum]